MRENNSYIFRPIKTSDLQNVNELTKKANSGLSNLPKTFEQTKSMITTSTNSFNDKVNSAEKKFIFVIEKNQKEIVGISGIKARTGVKRPYYSFIINDNVKYPYLELAKDYYGPSEIGSLFLCPKHRNKGIGRLLSLSRFLFIKSNPDLFTKTIIAELRGFLYKNNVSPVWNAIGKKFMGLSFTKADIESVKDIHYIPNNFPKKPIYFQLIPEKAIQYFKEVHPFTEPAKQLLLSENFTITNHIDIFDGGPKLECNTIGIRTIKNAKSIPLNEFEDHIDRNNNYLACNQNLTSFYCTKITKKTTLNTLKKSLNLKTNDNIFIIKERE